MKTRRHVSLALAAMVLLACSCPTIATATQVPLGVPTATSATTAAAATASPGVTSTPGATETASATPCAAIVTANLNANVRSGPGTIWDPPVGNLLTGQSAPVAGKNSEGTWWYIVFAGGPGGHGWIAGSTVTATCLPSSVAVIAAPPTPLPPSGTCKDPYVFRKIRSSDKVCVSPASKAQADADNAAAASRLCTATYGADACAEGYVWRDAFSGDHVCVSVATRTQAAADNAAAATRWVAGPYGPHTCIAGFVWREATGGDDVCTTPTIRTQTAAANAAAASHLCTATYGADTCAQGYVWRGAFSSDHVCVTNAVHDQVAADNAAAPSHTWP